jgi:hypothetical protein
VCQSADNSECCIAEHDYCQSIHGKKWSVWHGIKTVTISGIYKVSVTVHSESKKQLAQPPTDKGSQVVGERSWTYISQSLFFNRQPSLVFKHNLFLDSSTTECMFFYKVNPFPNFSGYSDLIFTAEVRFLTIPH